MVKVSAITLPALLAVLATLSAAAPTQKASSDIVASNAFVARDVAPVDYSSDAPEAPAAPEETIETVAIAARTNHGSRDHWGYDGHWWYRKNGKWYKDWKKYNQEYDQEYRKEHHMSYYYGRDGYKYEYRNGKWYRTNYHDDQYDADYWNNNYKRDVSEVDARATEVEETSDFVGIEARTNHGSEDHWGYDGHWWYRKNGKWYKDWKKYNQEYDQEYRKEHHMSYYTRDGYRYEWRQNKWWKTMSHEDKYDADYWNNNYKRDVSEVEARDVEVEEATEFAAPIEARTDHKDKHMDHKDYYGHHGYRHHWNGKSWEKCEYNGWYNREHKPYYSKGYLYEWNPSKNCYERVGDYNKSYRDGWAY